MAQKIVVDTSVALAVEVDCPLITADGRLFDRARSLPRVRHLSKVGPL